MFLEHLIYVQKKAFSRVVVKTWNEIPNNLKTREDKGGREGILHTHPIP